jgi:uncharacterized protein YndB with AHSA1/START domain
VTTHFNAGTDPTTMRIVRDVPAAPLRVWRAWTDPAELATWFWPASYAATAEIDLRIGGRYRVASAARGMAVSGEFVAVEEPNRLVQTWQWDGEDDVTLVTTEFRGADDGHTEVVITHERFAAATDRDNHAQGWNDCLDRLATHAF